MGLLEVLALSAAANIILMVKLVKAKYKLRGAVHSLHEVGAGRAEVIDLGDRIAVRHKVIVDEDQLI